ncbi:Os01g0944900, partial [Oryza sativa Japonica Group]
STTSPKARRRSPGRWRCTCSPCSTRTGRKATPRRRSLGCSIQDKTPVYPITF